MDLSNELSEEFIDEIAIFLDDMRILKSIVNEFYIYREKLKNSNKNKNGEVIPLEDSKMMSIIVYKNLFPKDFSLLHLGVGLVNEAFMDKNKFLIQLIKDVDDNIKEVENKLICTKSELLNNQEELSLIFTNYVTKYMSQVHTNQYNSNVSIGNLSCSINQPIWNGIDYSTLSNDTEIKVYNNAHKLFSLKELKLNLLDFNSKVVKANASKGIASFIESDLEFLRIFAFEDAKAIRKVKEGYLLML